MLFRSGPLSRLGPAGTNSNGASETYAAGAVRPAAHAPGGGVRSGLVLTTDVQPVKYSADAKKPALLRADGATDEEFKNYIKNITGVVVDGKNYSAGGKNAVVTVKSDGSIDVFADSLAKAGKYDVTVRSAGYPDLVFNYDASTARKAALEALKAGKEELEKKLKDAEKTSKIGRASCRERV